MSYKDAAGALSSAALSDDAGQPDEAAIDALLVESEQLEQELAQFLEHDRQDVRELAELQLEAASAVDLDYANRLASTAEGGEFAAALDDEEFSRLDEILRTPTESGISALVQPEVDAGLDDEASNDPKLALKAAFEKAVDGIAGDAVDAAKATISAMVDIDAGKLADSIAAKLGDRFAQALGHLRMLKKKVVDFVWKAISKLLAVFKIDEDKLKEKLKGWVGDMAESKIKGFVIETLYRVDELKKKNAALIDGADGLDGAKAKSGADALAALAAHWHQRTWVIGKIAGLLSKVRDKIFAFAPPYTGIAYTAAAVTATGYAILAGGDYLDWDESDGVLDRVEGVTTIVKRAVA
jgi:hypothetical protein